MGLSVSLNGQHINSIPRFVPFIGAPELLKGIIRHPPATNSRVKKPDIDLLSAVTIVATLEKQDQCIKWTTLASAEMATC